MEVWKIDFTLTRSSPSVCRQFWFQFFFWLPSLSLILTLPAGHCHLADYSAFEQLFLLPVWLSATARVADCKSLAAGFPPQFLPHFGSNFSPGLLPYSPITWCVWELFWNTQGRVVPISIMNAIGDESLTVCLMLDWLDQLERKEEKWFPRASVPTFQTNLRKVVFVCFGCSCNILIT